MPWKRRPLSKTQLLALHAADDDPRLYPVVPGTPDRVLLRAWCDGDTAYVEQYTEGMPVAGELVVFFTVPLETVTRLFGDASTP